MPFANNDGIRIYYEVEGEGPPLVLHHGNGASSVYLRITGHVELLKSDYRLILMDSRAHGRSDKPHDPAAYGWPARVADVTAVLDDLGIDRAHFLGYSMGGLVGWCIAKHAPERFWSLIIGAASPYDPDPDRPKGRAQLYRMGMKAAVGAMKKVMGARWTPEVEAMARANDLEALIVLMENEGPMGVENLLPTITLPVLLYAGDQDSVCGAMQEAANVLPNATFATVPGDHLEAEHHPAILVPHIRQFLTEVGEG